MSLKIKNIIMLLFKIKLKLIVKKNNKILKKNLKIFIILNKKVKNNKVLLIKWDHRILNPRSLLMSWRCLKIVKS